VVQHQEIFIWENLNIDSFKVILKLKFNVAFFHKNNFKGMMGDYTKETLGKKII
jgi:hypothetical protein